MYIQQVMQNAKIMAKQSFQYVDVISNGTENHIVLVDLKIRILLARI